MRSAFNGQAVRRFSALGLLGIVCGLPLGCGADDKFAADSDDEYKEPLTNAIIGTPTGVVEISSNGRSTITAGGKAGSTGGGGTAGVPKAGRRPDAGGPHQSRGGGGGRVPRAGRP